MRLKILNTTVVVLAEHHNPTILHPSFLENQKIVPKKWLLAEPPVCTPVFAVVKYKNGMVFSVVEENKFQVIDNQVPEDIKQSPVAGLAYKYVAKLPHVHYKAIGINFAAIIELKNPDEAILKRFLKRGSADYNGNKPNALGLRLLYKLPEARLRLSLDSGKAQISQEEPELEGILINANYHIELVKKDVIEEIKEKTCLYSEFCELFFKISQEIFHWEK